MFEQFNFSEIKSTFVVGAISAFGALVHSFYMYTKGQKTSWTHLIITLVIGFFVGQLVGSFLPKDFQYRDGILLICGFGCYSILDILNSHIQEFFDKLSDIISILSFFKKK